MTLNKFLKVINPVWILILAAIAVLFLNAGVFYMVKKAKSNFTENNIKLLELTAKRVALLQMGREKGGVDLERQRMESIFFSRQNAVDFITALENLAQSTGNSINIKKSENLESNVSGHQEFKVELSGNYAAAINFLAQLENFSYLAWPAEVDMSEYYDFESGRALVKTDLSIKVLSL